MMKSRGSRFANKQLKYNHMMFWMPFFIVHNQLIQLMKKRMKNCEFTSVTVLSHFVYFLLTFDYFSRRV